MKGKIGLYEFLSEKLIISLTIFLFTLITGCIEDIDTTFVFGDQNGGPEIPSVRFPDIPVSDQFSVWLNDSLIFTYRGGNMEHGFFSFAGFDFKNTARIRIRYEAEITHCKILPEKLGINYELLDANSLTFTLHHPEKITLLFNGSLNNSLTLLTALPETEKPDPDDPGVLYYTAGEVYDIGILDLSDNQTLYIERGAILDGMVRIKDASNVRIMGRGMIDGSRNVSSDYDPGGNEPWRLIYMDHAENVSIEGITLYNSKRWTIHPYACKGLNIKNIQILNWEYGSDGIDLSACQDVHISDCYLRTNDDAIAIKALAFGKAYYPNPRIQKQNVKNILVEGCKVWNLNWGNAFEIGYELRCDTVSNITFRDCDVLRQGSRGAVLSIHNGDQAFVENILYEDIRVVNAETGGQGKKLFDLAILYTLFSYDSYWGDAYNGHWDNLLSPRGYYGSAENRGWIRNVTFRNIEIQDENLPYSIVKGWNADHQVMDVLFENITMMGSKLMDESALGLIYHNNYYNDIQIR